MRNNHEIDYKIYGEELQFVEVELDPQETVIGEPGGFMMMEDGIEMQTIFGDGTNQQKGFLGKLLSAGKRVLTGENLFLTTYTNVGSGKKKVYFASPYPGKVIPLDLMRLAAAVQAENRAAARVLEKNGFSQVQQRAVTLPGGDSRVCGFYLLKR